MEAKNIIASLNQYKGKKVLNTTGNKCGVIEDFLIDQVSGDMRFILMSEGKIADNRYFVIPFNALTFENPDAQQTLNMPLEKFLKVSHIPKRKNDGEQASILEKIEAYYGMEKMAPIYNRQTDQTYEGSSQITDNIPPDNNAIGDEVAYDKIKGGKDKRF